MNNTVCLQSPKLLSFFFFFFSPILREWRNVRFRAYLSLFIHYRRFFLFVPLACIIAPRRATGVLSFPLCCAAGGGRETGMTRGALRSGLVRDHRRARRRRSARPRRRDRRVLRRVRRRDLPGHRGPRRLVRRRVRRRVLLRVPRRARRRRRPSAAGIAPWARACRERCETCPLCCMTSPRSRQPS